MYADLEIDKSKRTKEIYHTERNKLFNYLNKHNIELSDIIFNPERTNIDARYMPYVAYFIRRFDFKEYTLQNMFQLDDFLQRNILEKSDIVYNSPHVLRILEDTVLTANDGKFKTRILLFCMKRIIKRLIFVRMHYTYTTRSGKLSLNNSVYFYHLINKLHSVSGVSVS